MIILAGGKGTSLAPYTTVLPKPLMPLADIPVLEVVLRQLKRDRFRDVVICVGHLAGLIMAFFGDGARWGLNIRYAVEEAPLGTMGPLRTLPDLDGPFLVMNGDVLTDIDYGALVDYHGSHGGLATIAVARRHVTVPFGLIQFDENGAMTRFAEKPSLDHFVNMGIYVFSPGVLRYVPEHRPYGIDDLMAALLAAREHVQVFQFKGIWLDIGRPEDFEKAREQFVTHRLAFLPDS